MTCDLILATDPILMLRHHHEREYVLALIMPISKPNIVVLWNEAAPLRLAPFSSKQAIKVSILGAIWGRK